MKTHIVPARPVHSGPIPPLPKKKPTKCPMFRTFRGTYKFVKIFLFTRYFLC